MKLWLVLWSLGNIVGVAGPLPDEVPGCLAKAQEFNDHMAAQIATGGDIHGNPITPEARTLRAQCVQQPGRPVMGSDEPLWTPSPTALEWPR